MLNRIILQNNSYGLPLSVNIGSIKLKLCLSQKDRLDFGLVVPLVYFLGRPGVCMTGGSVAKIAT